MALARTGLWEGPAGGWGAPGLWPVPGIGNGEDRLSTKQRGGHAVQLGLRAVCPQVGPAGSGNGTVMSLDREQAPHG